MPFRKLHQNQMLGMEDHSKPISINLFSHLSIPERVSFKINGYDSAYIVLNLKKLIMYFNI